MAVRNVIIAGGQSNQLGPTADPARVGYRLAAVRFYNHAPMHSAGSLPEVDFNGFLDLQCYDDVNGKHGAELLLGETLNSAGIPTDIIKLCNGNTSMFDWLPEDSEDFGDIFQADLVEALGLLPAEHPGDTFRYFIDWCQGEAESATMSQALLWESRFNLFKGYTEATILATTGQTVDLKTVVCLTHIGIGDPDVLAVLRQAQTNVADRVVNGDDLPISGLHYGPTAQNTLGVRKAAAFQSLIVGDVVVETEPASLELYSAPRARLSLAASDLAVQQWFPAEIARLQLDRLARGALRLAGLDLVTSTAPADASFRAVGPRDTVNFQGSRDDTIKFR